MILVYYLVLRSINFMAIKSVLCFIYLLCFKLKLRHIRWGIPWRWMVKVNINELWTSSPCAVNGFLCRRRQSFTVLFSSTTITPGLTSGTSQIPAVATELPPNQFTTEDASGNKLIRTRTNETCRTPRPGWPSQRYDWIWSHTMWAWTLQLKF